MTKQPEKRCIYLATPLITSEVSTFYVDGLLDLYQHPPPHTRFKRRHAFPRDVIRARSRLLREFVDDKECTHILFIDGDNVPKHECLRGMLEAKKDIIAAPYPRREHHKQLRPGDTASGMRYSVIAKPGSRLEPGLVTLEILGIGFGFILLTRRAVEKILADHKYMVSPEAVAAVQTLPEPVRGELLKQLNNTFTDDFAGQNNALTTAVFSLLNSYGIRDDEDPSTSFMMGEDYSFCMRARQSGFKIYMYVGPGTPLEHDGVVRFTGNVDDLIHSCTTLTPAKDSDQ